MDGPYEEYYGKGQLENIGAYVKGEFIQGIDAYREAGGIEAQQKATLQAAGSGKTAMEDETILKHNDTDLKHKDESSLLNSIKKLEQPPQDKPEQVISVGRKYAGR